MQPAVKIFSGNCTHALAEKIANSYGTALGKINIQRFSDGEFQPVILESIRGDYVFLVQSTYAPTDNLMELLLMIDATRRASGGYITAVIPYFEFARQDRKDKPRVAIGSKLIAQATRLAARARATTRSSNA